MKSKSELQKLSKMCSASQNVLSKGLEYIKARSQRHVFENQNLLREWEVGLNNLLTAINTSKSIFSNNEVVLRVLMDMIKENVEIPRRLKKRFNDKDDISIKNVLYIARQDDQHVEKTNNEKYILLADAIPHNTLLKITLLVDGLISREWNSLSNEELQLAISTSIETKRRISGLQAYIENIELQQLQQIVEEKGINADVKVLEDFLNFEPNQSNVLIHRMKNKYDK